MQEAGPRIRSFPDGSPLATTPAVTPLSPTGSLPAPPLADSPGFHAYRPVLAAWLDGRCDEHALYQASAELCRTVRSYGAQPEQIVVALHDSGIEQRGDTPSQQAVARDRRYASAVFILMQACFGVDLPLRVVRGVDGAVGV